MWRKSKDKKCQKAEPQAASSSSPRIRQRVCLCARVCVYMSVCLWERRSTFPPTQSHDSTEPAPGVGLRERKSDGEKAFFRERERERER